MADDEYTPTTDRVRDGYGIGWFADDEEFEHDPMGPDVEFDRWLAQTIREAKAEAWRRGVADGREDALYEIEPRITNPYRENGDGRGE